MVNVFPIYNDNHQEYKLILLPPPPFFVFLPFSPFSSGHRHFFLITSHALVNRVTCTPWKHKQLVQVLINIKQVRFTRLIFVWSRTFPRTTSRQPFRHTKPLTSEHEKGHGRIGSAPVISRPPLTEYSKQPSGDFPFPAVSVDNAGNESW